MIIPTFFDFLEKTGKLEGDFALVYLNGEGRISRASGGVEEFLGVSSENLVGKRVASIYRKVKSKIRRNRSKPVIFF